MTGHKIKLGKGVTLTRDGKLKRIPVFRDVSQAIAAKKSPKQKFTRAAR